MKLLNDVERPGSSIDTYVSQVSQVLDNKIKMIMNLKERVKQFELQLKKEETMSKSMKRS